MGTLPWIDEKKLASEFPQLFHYTNESSLAAILESGGMYATHYERTNDRAEAKTVGRPLAERMTAAAFPLVLELARIRNVRLARSPEQLRSEMLDNAMTFFNAVLKTCPTPPHITCFSAHVEPHHKANGLLTMWRLYGRGKIGEGERDGVGVALGFNTEKLRLATEGIQEKHGTYCIYLDRVRYGEDDPEVQRRVDDSPSIATLYAKSVIAMIQGALEPPTDLTTEDADKLTVLFPCAKHEDFEDERETRLVVCPALEVSLAGRAPLVGPDGRVVVRYLDALEEVLVGPSNKQDQLFASVSATLKAKGFERVLVKKSETPFRFL